MKNIIEETLSEFAAAYPQLNFGSKAARTMLAAEINSALLKEIEQRTDSNRWHQVMPEGIIREALGDGGYVAGDSGYEFSTGIRDIEFHKGNDTYQVTIQHYQDEDTFEL